MTYYTPRNIQRLIDPAMGTGGFMFDIATGAGKSRDIFDLIGNPPFITGEEMTDPWAAMETHNERERAYRLKHAIARMYTHLQAGDTVQARSVAIETLEGER